MSLLVLHVVLIFALAVGCRKAAPETQTSSSEPTGEKQPSLLSPRIIVNRNRLPEATIKWSAALANAYESAALASAPYQLAMPYLREKILLNALPQIKTTLEQYKTEAQKQPRLENIKLLMLADSRFAGVASRKAVQDLFKSILPKDETDAPIPESETIKDLAKNAPTTEPQIQDNRASSVSHVGPLDVFRSVAAAGTMIAVGTFGLQDDEELTRESLRIEKAIEEQNANPDSELTLQQTDSLSVSGAKMGLKGAFGDFLGKIAAYKRSFFVGSINREGALQIWELKQAFLIKISRQQLDTKTELNTGMELSANFEIIPVGNDSLFRSYGEGMWGTWKQPPAIHPIHIEKAVDWTIERKPYEDIRCFTLLSAAQIDAALEKSDTNKAIGKSEQLWSSGRRTSLSADNLASLISFYSAQVDSKNAVDCADELLSRDQITIASAKATVSALSELLRSQNAVVGDAFYRANFFDFYGSYQNLGMIPDFKESGASKRGGEAHPYKIVPGATVTQIIKAYKIVVENEPGNADAQFDLALLCVLAGYAEHDTIRANEDFKLSAQSLAKALALAKNHAPESGRNFASVILQTPSFFPIICCDDIDVKNQFNSVLRMAGSSNGGYHQAFTKSIRYYNEGY